MAADLERELFARGESEVPCGDGRREADGGVAQSSIRSRTFALPASIGLSATSRAFAKNSRSFCDGRWMSASARLRPAPSARRGLAVARVYERARGGRRSMRRNSRATYAAARSTGAGSDRFFDCVAARLRGAECVRVAGWRFGDGVTCLNSPGTIDADYRGEVHVVLANLGTEPVVIHRGDRIAQMVVAPVSRASFEVVDELPPTVRGERRFRFARASFREGLYRRQRRGRNVSRRLAGAVSASTFAYAPRERRESRAVRCRRCDRRDQSVRYRRRDRNAAQSDRLSGKVRFRVAAERRWQRREIGSGLRCRQRGGGRADDAGRPGPRR